MNLFRLDDNPYLAAKYNQDLHVRKIIVEAAQLLANCYSIEQLKDAPKTQSGNVRKYSHIHHPVSKWAKETNGNWQWTVYHAMYLCEEFYYRFGKEHFCRGFVFWCFNENLVPYNIAEKENIHQTEQPQCFKQHPDCIVPGDPVAGYRNYYRTAKKTFDIRGKTVHATWTKRDIPEWFK